MINMERKSLIYLILFITIGALASVALIYALWLFKKEPILGGEVRKILKRESTGREQAILSLISDKEYYSVNEDVVVDIFLDSQENLVDGVDLILKYDSQMLQLSEANFFDTTDSVFSAFPYAKIDEIAGQIKISAITSPGRSFQGKGKIGSLHFKAQKGGQALISFVFGKGSTTDSNVSSYAYPQDILSQVENLAVKIY